MFLAVIRMNNALYIVREGSSNRIPMMKYFMCNGGSTFQEIRALDDEFFPALGKAMLDPKMDIWLQRLDISSDLDCGILEMAKNAIFSKRYKSNLTQPYLFGSVGNTKIKGSVTQVITQLYAMAALECNQTAENIQDSINRKAIDDEYLSLQKLFTLETVYFGNDKSPGVTVSIYGKQKEQLIRNAMSLQPNQAGSRIEVRDVFAPKKLQLRQFGTWQKDCLFLLMSKDNAALNERAHYLFLEGLREFEFTIKTRTSFDRQSKRWLSSF